MGIENVNMMITVFLNQTSTGKLYLLLLETLPIIRFDLIFLGMHMTHLKSKMRCFLPDESIDTDRGFITLGWWSRPKIVHAANIFLIEFSTNSELFIADILLLNIAVFGVFKNGSLYSSCTIFKSVSFALIVFF